MAVIRIGFSYNQEGPIEEHFRKAGLTPVWLKGLPTSRYPQGNVLRKGLVEGWGKDLELIKTRSSRIPKRVSEGVYDLGLVGTDIYDDHFLKNTTIVGRFDHGRKNGHGNSYLELVATRDSAVITVEDLTPGTIVHTEVPHLTKKFLQERGFKTALYWNTQQKSAFKERLVRSGRIGLELSPGGVAQDLQPDEVLALVTESGDTREDYGLRSIAKICDIDTLLIANKATLVDPEKVRSLRFIITSLDGSHIYGESEGPAILDEGFHPAMGGFESPTTLYPGSPERG